MKKLVSIIVPVYNVKDYLDKCLDSLINQTYRNLEILLINDESTDNSLDICLKYQEKDKRIKVYNKKNGGPASARNYGLNRALGDYIIFVDSDDYIDINAIELLVQNSKNYDLIGLCVKQNRQPKIKKFEYNQSEFLKLFAQGKTFGCGGCCGHLFKRDIIDNIRFDENLYLPEDILFLFEYSMKIKKIKYLEDDTYYYYVNNLNSITRKNDQNLRKIKSINDVFNKMDKISNYKLHKIISKKKVKMLEKEMRYVKDIDDIKNSLKIIVKIKYYGFNLRYNIFCYLINHKKVNLLLLYYKSRRNLKKILRKSI